MQHLWPSTQVSLPHAIDSVLASPPEPTELLLVAAAPVDELEADSPPAPASAFIGANADVIAWTEFAPFPTS
jgi:hypothetical protein